MNCPNCNAPIAADEQFCGECGYKIERPAEPAGTVSTAAAEQPTAETAAPSKKKKRTCLIVLAILVAIVVCVVLAGLLYDEIIWQLRPRAVGYLPYLLGVML